MSGAWIVRSAGGCLAILAAAALAGLAWAQPLLQQPVTEFPVPTAGGEITEIAAGFDGYLWFTEHTGNKIGRIDWDGTIREFAVPSADSSPWGIAAGLDG